jgi:hypothetical protein
MNPILAAATLLILGRVYAQGPETIPFKRTFKLNESSVYACTFASPGQKAKMTSAVACTVTKLEAGSATVEYKALDVIVDGKLNKSPAPALTSKVGANDMPEEALPSHQDDILFVVLGAASITPNASVDPAHPVKVHWDNKSGNLSFDGSGTIKAIDKTAKTLTVEWDLTMNSPGYPAGQYKLTSVYSTDDFSLKSSNGTVTINNAPPMAVSISKAEAANR